MIKKNDIQHKCKLHKIFIQLQIELKIALFSKSILSFALLKIYLRCDVFVELWLHTNVMRILVI